MRIGKFLYFGDFFAIPIALAIFIWLAWRAAGVAAAAEFLPGLAGGLLIWTLAEYWIHRALYHRAPGLSAYHRRHHDEPDALIGIPSFLSSGIVILFGYGPPVAFAPIIADGFASGALIGYAAYMGVHHAVHHWPIAPGDWLYPARRRHLAHHYHEESDFGVVTGLWDRVFGTTGRRRDRADAKTRRIALGRDSR
jgi:sterol desaturase/sphingolipid hydroxylase (fatty acid hydroxylase superfamily)